jgi:N-acetylglucosamine kinase-like BadF-type ATPase
MVYIGIDGGGSTVRVVVVTPDLSILGQSRGGSVNPNSAGRDAAASALHAAIREALAAAQVTAGDVTAVGAGVAGAMTAPLNDWLRDTLSSIVPDVPVFSTHDIEIALIAAHGIRRGVLVLAGTGSAALGVSPTGESLLVGGWGYLLGDEGSGAWLGLRALNAVACHADGRGEPTRLTDAIMNLLQLSDARQLIEIIYQPAVPVAPRAARFAPLVLEHAEVDGVASRLVDEAVKALALHVETIVSRLRLVDPGVAFAGGLLSSPNVLSLRLQSVLRLAAFPAARYPAEVGAALLAMERMMEA